MEIKCHSFLATGGTIHCSIYSRCWCRCSCHRRRLRRHSWSVNCNSVDSLFHSVSVSSRCFCSASYNWMQQCWRQTTLRAIIEILFSYRKNVWMKTMIWWAIMPQFILEWKVDNRQCMLTLPQLQLLLLMMCNIVYEFMMTSPLLQLNPECNGNVFIKFNILHNLKMAKNMRKITFTWMNKQQKHTRQQHRWRCRTCCCILVTFGRGRRCFAIHSHIRSYYTDRVLSNAHTVSDSHKVIHSRLTHEYGFRFVRNCFRNEVQSSTRRWCGSLYGSAIKSNPRFKWMILIGRISILFSVDVPEDLQFTRQHSCPMTWLPGDSRNEITTKNRRHENEALLMSTFVWQTDWVTDWPANANGTYGMCRRWNGNFDSSLNDFFVIRLFVLPTIRRMK